MATGRVRAGFLHIRTRGPDPARLLTGFFSQARTRPSRDPRAPRAPSSSLPLGPNLKALNLYPIKKTKKKKFPGFTSEITKLQIIAKPFSLMHCKLETLKQITRPMLSFSTLHITNHQKKKNYRIYQLSNQKQYNPTQ